MPCFPSRVRPRCGACGGRLGGFGARSVNGATAMSCSSSSRASTGSRAARLSGKPGRLSAITCCGNALRRSPAREKGCCARILAITPPEPKKFCDTPAMKARDSDAAARAPACKAAWIAWQSALARAQEPGAVEDLHAFVSQQGFTLPDGTAFAAVGHRALKAQLKSLASSQDAIGVVWHDRQVFHQAVAEALARAEVLLNEMPAVRILFGGTGEGPRPPGQRG